jgi:hypothetical protein
MNISTGAFYLQWDFEAHFVGSVAAFECAVFCRLVC